MVTKLDGLETLDLIGLSLTKIHMVTKPQN